MSELVWGPILAGYLFLGGLAGGAYVIGALVDLFKSEDYDVVSKSGTYVSLISIIVGLVLLVLDLKRFEVAPLGILNAYRRFPNSILTVGTWIITGFTVVSLLTTVLWLLNGNKLVRKILGVVGIILGLSTMAYTGLLLSFSRGSPFWSTPYLPWTFVISGMLTGLAVSLFMIPIIAIFMPRAFKDFLALFEQRSKFSEMLGRSQRYVTVFILVELALVIIEIATGHQTGILLTGSGISLAFYAYLLMGLIFPLGISYYMEKLKSGVNDISIIMFSMSGYILVLIGGFLLRYVILTAGQLIH
jgi:formate-dependent nitrite reductase membrane component NrfD